jgi:putative thioredoxin
VEDIMAMKPMQTLKSLLGGKEARPAPTAAPAAQSAPLAEGMIGAAPAGAADLIKDTTTQSFMADVIEASQTVPVLVDFWAPWCGPCRQLTPILEKLVRAARGKIKLVKMNIDADPAIPGQMGVQSIPAVFAFVKGRPVDGFMGALPESQIKTFIDRLTANVTTEETDGIADAMAAADEMLAAGDPLGAAEIFSELLAVDKDNLEAITGLARCQIAAGELDEAAATLALVPVAKVNAAIVASVRATLDLARKAPGAAAGAEAARALAAKVQADPTDLQARFDLSLALNAAGDKDGAVDQLLDIMKRDRTWNEDGARKQLVQLFDAWGPKDPVTLAGRKRLSLALFS